ncbi:hypothetical protein GLAREA_00307 [Glarea lozoyensis ATCC 20868]|uniref:Uncharacterized protein n=1 Tax=Glarea lozoyensis (strain ATCC 20868 / MF5171) TaxID=1116229 RepID=S3CRQ5_GLAL2|nr:uncharacterized protein GLAREA_00307 [Glarea lozoyensis ATCC 20868]EPE29147.1 hypothetical protein GLAREA_00307 [Glarea lozoyensis ATCC 20868]
MDNVDSNFPDRIFREVDVGSFSRQTAESRFPRPRRGEDDDRPALAHWRNNLTALSQKHNLYFAAVEDHIHVTVPRNVKHSLPGTPDLNILLPTSVQAEIVGGHLDEDNGHCVNHLIIGNLGDEEIILIACDDGDLVGYYTNVINQVVNAKTMDKGGSHSQRTRGRTFTFDQTDEQDDHEDQIRHMFHENVGKSAWGLAIHSYSRLIAVSTNIYQVTIFAFAIRDEPKDEEDEEKLTQIESAAARYQYTDFPSITPDEEKPRWATDKRQHGYRLVFSLPTLGANIPTVAFVNDLNGEAEDILAGDTAGRLWTINLWSRRGGEVLQKQFSVTGGEMVWGILVIPVGDFLVESSPHKALGMPHFKTAISFDSIQENNTRKDTRYLNISSTAVHTSDHTVRARRNDPEYCQLKIEEDGEDAKVIISSTDSGNSGEVSATDIDPIVKARRYRYMQCFSQDDAGEEEIRHEAETFRSIMNLPPMQMESKRSWRDLAIQARATVGTRKKKAKDREDGTIMYRESLNLGDGSALLRLYNWDIELIPPTKGILTTVLKSAISHPFRQTPPHLDDLAHNRLNMHRYIPQLSLVVAGSQTGDVALLTLTRMPDNYSKLGLVTTFRLDHILPFKHHMPSPRRRFPLLGLATSPVPGNEQRFRILLHFMDHSIVSYEVWRGVKGEILLI